MSMKEKKLEILQQATEALIREIPQNSYVMIARFGDSYEWLTPTPVQANDTNKESLIASIKEKRESLGGIDICPLLKAIFEMDFEIDYPRSVIILSNGNLKEQGALERLMSNSRAVRDTRVSAIGIGSGSSDSFLRIIASKGLGLIESLTTTNILEARCKMFMARLRARCIKNVVFEYDESQILQVLPLNGVNQSFLKSAAIEVYIYYRDLQPQPNKKQSVTMHYFDEEDKTKKQLTILPGDALGSLQPDMHKLCISELLFHSDELRSKDKDKQLIQTFGKNWTVNLAVEHQVFSSETAYLAIAQQLPMGYDPLNDDLTSLKTRQATENDLKTKKIVVGSLILNDYIKTVTAPNTPALNTDISHARFTPSNFDVLSRRHQRDRGPRSAVGNRATQGESLSTTNSNSDSLAGKTAAERLTVLDMANQDDYTHEDQEWTDLVKYVRFNTRSKPRADSYDAGSTQIYPMTGSGSDKKSYHSAGKQDPHAHNFEFNEMDSAKNAMPRTPGARHLLSPDAVIFEFDYSDQGEHSAPPSRDPSLDFRKHPASKLEKLKDRENKEINREEVLIRENYGSRGGRGGKGGIFTPKMRNINEEFGPNRVDPEDEDASGVNFEHIEIDNASEHIKEPLRVDGEEDVVGEGCASMSERKRSSDSSSSSSTLKTNSDELINENLQAIPSAQESGDDKLDEVRRNKLELARKKLEEMISKARDEQAKKISEEKLLRNSPLQSNIGGGGQPERRSSNNKPFDSSQPLTLDKHVSGPSRSRASRSRQEAEEKPKRPFGKKSEPFDKVTKELGKNDEEEYDKDEYDKDEHSKKLDRKYEGKMQPKSKFEPNNKKVSKKTNQIREIFGRDSPKMDFFDQEAKKLFLSNSKGMKTEFDEAKVAKSPILGKAQSKGENLAAIKPQIESKGDKRSPVKSQMKTKKLMMITPKATDIFESKYDLSRRTSTTSALGWNTKNQRSTTSTKNTSFKAMSSYSPTKRNSSSTMSNLTSPKITPAASPKHMPVQSFTFSKPKPVVISGLTLQKQPQSPSILADPIRNLIFLQMSDGRWEASKQFFCLVGTVEENVQEVCLRHKLRAAVIATLLAIKLLLKVKGEQAKSAVRLGMAYLRKQQFDYVKMSDPILKELAIASK